LPDPELSEGAINVVASTDILEYLERKSMRLVIYRFAELVNLGIYNYKQLTNEFNLTRSDRTREVALEIINLLPRGWKQLL